MDESKIKEVLEAGGDDLHEKITTLLNQEISGLKENRDKILAEKKELAIKVDNLSKKVDNFPVSEYNELKEQAEKSKLIKSGSSQEQVDLQMALTRIETEKDTLQKKLEDSLSQTEKIRARLQNGSIQSALSDAFTRAGVLPDTLEVLKSAYSGRAEAQLKENGSIDVLMKTSEGGLLPIKDWVDGWANSPEAKTFIKANALSGSGATGSGGSVVNRSKMTLDDATKYVRQYGQAAFEALPK